VGSCVDFFFHFSGIYSKFFTLCPIKVRKQRSFDYFAFNRTAQSLLLYSFLEMILLTVETLFVSPLITFASQRSPYLDASSNDIIDRYCRITAPNAC